MDERILRVAANLGVTPKLVEFVVLIEDRRFWWHPGVDPIAISRALVMWCRQQGLRQGGSTITEQLVKAGTRQTVRSRVARIFKGLLLTTKEGKRETLSRYLASVYFGKGSFGIEAAAWRYFRTTGASVTTAQAFFLAERIAVPSTFRPARVANIIRRVDIQRALGDSLWALPSAYGEGLGATASQAVENLLCTMRERNARRAA